VKLSRRAVLTSAAAAALPLPAIAQSRPVKFTLPWLAQGNNMFTYVGRERGYFKSRGIDLGIARGFGTIAAAQAVGGGQFDFGMGVIMPMMIQRTKDLPITFLGTIDYDSLMGVGVRGDGPITNPKQLAGKKLAQVPASADTPLFPPYAKLVGLDVKTVDIVGTDPKLLERLLILNQVDAITSVGSSSIPVIVSQNVPVRWMLYSAGGLSSYGMGLITRPDILAKDPGLCGAFCDGMMESLAWVLQNPDEAEDVFFKAVPEMGLNPAGRTLIRIGMDALQFTVPKPPAREHGMLWGDPAVYGQMMDMLVQNVLPPGTKPPPVEAYYTNQFAGHIKLSDAQWDKIAANGGAFSKLLA
jgi:NitT/TauT family transport system substrate-binding protein